MELRDIKYIIAVADELNFTRAADRLFISQSTLSLCVQKVEKSLNTKLFIREHNRLKLTQSGRIFVEDGRKILALSDSMIQKIQDIDTFSDGIVKVGISRYYSSYFIPDLVQRFKNSYPGVKVEIVEDLSLQMEKMVSNGDLDLCIMPTPIMSEDLQFESLFCGRIYFATSKNISNVRPHMVDDLPSIEISDLKAVKDLPFIMPKKGQKMRGILDDICAEAGFEPKVIFESANMATINNFIALDMGVGFVTDVIEYKSDKKDLVNYYIIKSDKATRNYGFVFKKNTVLNAECQAFIKMGHEQFEAFRR